LQAAAETAIAKAKNPILNEFFIIIKSVLIVCLVVNTLNKKR
jgi:hypothetical protein